MAFQGSNRRRFSESLSAASTPSQIIATLRSALPSGINALTASQASQIISNSRATGLSEYANMLSIPSFTSGGRLVSNSNANNSHGHASVHPSFRSKSVCLLECKSCDQIICGRGMKAILLSDTRVELFSTDIVPSGVRRVQLVGEDYMTNNCHCRIRDVACLGCGNVCGYHVTQPCDNCMGACNNGHFWMFHDDAVRASERLDASGKSPLLWAHISQREVEDHDRLETICR